METLPKPDEKLWHDGANYAADAIVISQNNCLLLIKRLSGEWALPGGFVDPNELSSTTAMRELDEETGLSVDKPGVLVYSGKVNDPRNSSSRWIESDAYLFDDIDEIDVAGNDDATDARWWPLDELPDSLYGSHQEMVADALLFRQLTSSEHKQPVLAGHMSYDRYIVPTEELGPVFIKAHCPEMHQDTLREERARQYLERESAIMEHLRHHGCGSIPTYSRLLPNSLMIMEGLLADQGWHWNAPESDPTDYISDTLRSLSELQLLDLPPEDNITPSYQTFIEEGWLELRSADVQQSVKNTLSLQCPNLHPDTAHYAKSLSEDLSRLADSYNLPDASEICYFSHHDARQSNIAWHPEHGAKLVDWSWAGRGPINADSTSLLIDLAKSGHDVSPYMADYFNPHHALTLIGFWLGHSILPTRIGNESVRLHQVASAATAYQLLCGWEEARGSAVCR